MGGWPAYRGGRGDSRVTRRPTSATLAGMLTILEATLGALLAALRPRASLVAENLLLRQQLAILRRTHPRPRLRPIDRAFWVVVSRIWSRWADTLAIVQPATVIGWHRRGFARFWAWKSRPVGRRPLAPELVSLIEQMARENPLWSRRRIASDSRSSVTTSKRTRSPSTSRGLRGALVVRRRRLGGRSCATTSWVRLRSTF
jgi:hypothetical protein